MNRLPEEMPDIDVAAQYRCIALSDLIRDWEKQALDEALET